MPIHEIDHPLSAEAAHQADEARGKSTAAETLMQADFEGQLECDLRELAGIELVRMAVENEGPVVHHAAGKPATGQPRQQPVVAPAAHGPVPSPSPVTRDGELDDGAPAGQLHARGAE